jgi:hypothetical protein
MMSWGFVAQCTLALEEFAYAVAIFHAKPHNDNGAARREASGAHAVCAEESKKKRLKGVA